MGKDETVHAQLELLADFQSSVIMERIKKAAAEKVGSTPHPEGTETLAGIIHQINSQLTGQAQGNDLENFSQPVAGTT